MVPMAPKTSDPEAYLLTPQGNGYAACLSKKGPKGRAPVNMIIL